MSRFAWHSRMILAQLVRAMAYSAAGSALWALLPVIAQRQLGTGAQGFGLLMGCMGTGAVATGLVIGRMRARFLDAVVGASCVAFSAVMLLAAWVRVPLLVHGAMAVGGAAWIAAMSTFNTATQSSAPPWVRSRAVAVEVAYRIRPGADHAFLDTIGQMKAPRRRDGATFWRVYKDLGEPSRYVERFLVTSWADYLHQRARATVADHTLEAEVRAFLAHGESVRTSHYIAER